GIAVFDNMLWSGTVMDPKDEDAKALRETAELIKNNHRLEPLLLPVRDGVMIYRKVR
ncbi:MAG: methyltransferase, partial [Candidatus Marinimicrobia bacterium]|nr:methyltransferase [Candidatus Neomarinimicrobiota bacterium]MBT5115553.1 methyltransferase [Candidatus Neomarinimicrobiota bacterium]MBT6796925.1 methyltransferase [Candidatus Neomarinimicrobiota bacterium]